MSSERSPLSTLIVFFIVIVLIVGSGALLLASRPEPVEITINPPIPTATPEPTSTPSPILIYITGAVQQPEITVELPYNSRVLDAISAAGGFTDNANQSLVNIAGILHDGDQVHVPTTGVNTATDQLPTPSGGNLVYVNTATIVELQTLPGIGQAMAERIIAYREENGPFNQLEDLDNVSGIGDATLETLAELIAFD